MSNENLPATQDQALMPQTFDGMMKQAEVLVRSGLLPAEVKTPAAAVAIMMTGRELSIPPMQAFRSIYVVKGKPTLSAQLMGALIFRAGHSYKVVESTNEQCTIEFKRRGGEVYSHTFTIKDADRASLMGSMTWKQYPKAMLFSRCMSAGARAFMPDVIAGMYTPEEIAGEAVQFDGEHYTVVEGEVVTEESQEEEPKAKPVDWPKVMKALAQFDITENALPLLIGPLTPAQYSEKHGREAVEKIYRVVKAGVEDGLDITDICNALGVGAVTEWVTANPSASVDDARSDFSAYVASYQSPEQQSLV